MTVSGARAAGRQPDTSLRGELALLPRTVWVLAAGSLVNRFGSFVVPFLVLYLIHRGYSSAEAASAVSAYAVGKIAAGPLGGRLAERAGARTAVVTSMLGSAAATLALAAMHGLGLILLMTTITGLSSEAYRPATTVIMTGVDPKRRTLGFSVYQLGVSIGTTAGPAIGGLAAERGFAVLFLADAATSVLWAIVAWRALPDTGPEIALRQAGHRRREQGVLTDHRFLRLLVVTVLVNTILFQAQTTLPVWVHSKGMSSGTYGLLLALNSGLVMALQIPATRLTPRWETTSVIAVTSLLVGTGFALLAVGHTIVLLVAAVTIWSAGELVQWPVAADYTVQLAPPGFAGRYAGARSFCYGVALLLAPVAGAALYQLGPVILWLSCAAAGICAAMVISASRSSRWRRRRSPGAFG